MTGLTKAAAYARALARELPGEPANLFRLASRLGLEIREVTADGFDGALIRAREVPLGAIVIRKSIREAGRNTQGVKLVNLADQDKLQAIAQVIGEDKEDSAVEAEK